MSNLTNAEQSILASGSSILALIPTVILVLGSPNEDTIRISARYPLLAFFLSITCINKRSQVNKMRLSSSVTVIDLGPYGTLDKTTSSLKDLEKKKDTPYLLHRLAHWKILGAHMLACGGAGVILWSTIDLAVHGVVTWACWTSFYPIIWLALAIVNYVAAVISIRHSLKLPSRLTTSPNDADETGSMQLLPISSMEQPRSHSPPTSSTVRTDSRFEGDRHPLPNVQTRFDDDQAREAQPSHSVAKSALLILDLQPDCGTAICSRRKFADLSKAGVDLLNNATYLYGTAIFSSLTMVSGHNAIKVLCVYASVAVISRVTTEWVLEDIGGAD
ncbi:hypothetical protein B5807_11668 [Epicoccum nigrum]|uniref:Uncharacterized protein n=1 Tax=Epicoccum nigrum TaxID=105696 RepID=A0A1Y2LJT4_EPING|nr:hypothetical protein B5807_11668 [Epicoccum nigrum]